MSSDAGVMAGFSLEPAAFGGTGEARGRGSVIHLRQLSAHGAQAARDASGVEAGLELPATPVRLRASGEPGPWLETVYPPRGEPKLLVVNPGEAPIRANGLCGPRVAVLSHGDELEWSDDVVFQVTIFNRPILGPPPADWIGKECPVCRVPFTEDSKTYTCPGCGTVMHCDLESPEGLQCATLLVSAGCPRCQRAVVLEPGYKALTPEGVGT